MSKTKQADTPAGKDAQQPETDFEATHRDEFAGQGGEYEIRDGKRVLVHRTKSGPEAAAPDAAGQRGF